MDSQLARIDYEIDNGIQWISTSSYPLSFQEFRVSNETPEYLAQAFIRNYERPADQTQPNRSTQARYWFDNTTGDGGGGVGGSTPAFPTTVGLQITDTYGWRTNPVTGEYKFHAAIDIGGGGSTHPLYATQDGIIAYNGTVTNAGYGIRIQHTADPYFSQYLHLDNPSPIPEGTHVTKGQEIGTMGNGGNSTGIHLDFAIATRLDGFFTEEGTIDPEAYLKMLFGGGGGGGDDGEAEKKKKAVYHLLLADTLNGWKF
jgi:murein DD-endopeptidase MepM/ murein hydrolase activator NlpD